MAPDSPLVARMAPSAGHRRGKYLPRTSPVWAIVVHTTGSGPARRLTDDKFRVWRARNPTATASTFEAACWVFANQDASAHYVVGQGGELAQTAPENECAWHVGTSGGRAYRDGWAQAAASTPYAWWSERWPGMESPRDLAGGFLWDGYQKPPGLRGFAPRILSSYARGSVNANTIGIEVAPNANDPRGPWSDECWQSLSALVLDIASRHGMVVMRDSILTHSDANPKSRTAAGGRPWDPGERQWDLARMKHMLGIAGEW